MKQRKTTALLELPPRSMHNLWADTPPFTRKEERESTALKKTPLEFKVCNLEETKVPKKIFPLKEIGKTFFSFSLLGLLSCRLGDLGNAAFAH